MNRITKTTRWVSMLALAAAATLAGARELDENTLVWVENEHFGFQACGREGLREDAASTMQALRNSASAEVAQVAGLAGVPLGQAQFLTITPVDGRFACGAEHSVVVFRVAAVDRQSGKFWSSDLTVRGDDAAPDTTSTVALANDLAQALRGVYARSAMR